MERVFSTARQTANVRLISTPNTTVLETRETPWFSHHVVGDQCADNAQEHTVTQ